MSLDPFLTGPDLSAKEAADALVAYGISIAEGGRENVPKHDYRSAHDAMLADPVARRAANGVLRRCNTPDLLWGHLRSVATGSGSWALRRAAVHELLDPVLAALDRVPHPADELVSGAAERLDSESVREDWTRALARRDSSPTVP